VADITSHVKHTTTTTTTTMPNFLAIGRTITEMLQFFDFQDGSRPPSWILKM